MKPAPQHVGGQATGRRALLDLRSQAVVHDSGTRGRGRTAGPHDRSGSPSAPNPGTDDSVDTRQLTGREPGGRCGCRQTWRNHATSARSCRRPLIEAASQMASTPAGWRRPWPRLGTSTPETLVIMHVIKTTAQRMAGALQMPSYSARDAEQDLHRDLLLRMDSYDAARSNLRTFATRLICNRSVTVINTTIGKRSPGASFRVSLDAPGDPDRGIHLANHELISSEFTDYAHAAYFGHPRRGLGNRPAARIRKSARPVAGDRRCDRSGRCQCCRRRAWAVRWWSMTAARRYVNVWSGPSGEYSME